MHFSVRAIGVVETLSRACRHGRIGSGYEDESPAQAALGQARVGRRGIREGEGRGDAGQQCAAVASMEVRTKGTCV
ncbi:hypothetical protein GCM10010524_27970 [Streptomyces mexicanus]